MHKTRLGKCTLRWCASALARMAGLITQGREKIKEKLAADRWFNVQGLSEGERFLTIRELPITTAF